MALNPSQLQTLAEAGDSDAQYQLALALLIQGRTRRARRWLAQAAGAGHAAANHALAITLLDSRGPDYDLDNAIAHLRAARSQIPAANTLLSSVAASWSEAAKITRQGARHGQAGAQRQIGVLLQFYHDKKSAKRGRTLLALAAESGDVIAQLILARLSQNAPDNRGGERIRAWLEANLKAGHPLAQIIHQDPLLMERRSPRDFESAQPLPERQWGFVIATSEKLPDWPSPAGPAASSALPELLSDYLIAVAHAALSGRPMALEINGLNGDLITRLIEEWWRHHHPAQDQITRSFWVVPPGVQFDAQAGRQITLALSAPLTNSKNSSQNDGDQNRWRLIIREDRPQPHPPAAISMRSES